MPITGRCCKTVSGRAGASNYFQVRDLGDDEASSSWMLIWVLFVMLTIVNVDLCNLPLTPFCQVHTHTHASLTSLRLAFFMKLLQVARDLC